MSEGFSKPSPLHSPGSMKVGLTSLLAVCMLLIQWHFGLCCLCSWMAEVVFEMTLIRKHLAMVGRFRCDDPRFWDFQSEWVPFSASSNPSNSQARSDWPLIVLIFNPIDPLFPNFQSNWPSFLNPVRSDWVHFSSLCWASLPKTLPSTPLGCYHVNCIDIGSQEACHLSTWAYY